MEQFENDNELLYMYRIQSQSANCLIQKYEKRIEMTIMKELRYLSLNHREEIKQLSLIKLTEVIDKYREDKNVSFQHYFKRVMDNLIADYLRSLQREYRYLQEMGQSYPNPEISDGEWWYYSSQGRNICFQNPTEGYIRDKEMILAVWKKCTPIQKKIFYLKMLGYNQKEIALKLRKKESNISYHMKIIREIHDKLESC